MTMRKKPLSVLKANVRELPRQIERWSREGRASDAQRAERILAESRAELVRRGA
jgi:hypothetical protein